MSQPPPNGPYPGQPGQPPMGPPPGGMPPTGGQPPMGPPPPGGMPPGGDPYGPPGGMPPGGDPYGPPGGMPPGGDPYGQYGPPPGGHGPPGGPPQNKTSPWLFVGLGCGGLFVIGLVLVILIAFVFNDDSGGDSTSSSQGQQEESTDEDGISTDRENPDMPGLNEEVQHDGMYFTVTQVETGVDSIDTHTPIGEYVIVHIDVANASGDIETFWRDEQHVYTFSGEQIEEDYDATGNLSTGMSVDLDTSGRAQSVEIAFDVPDTSELSHVGLSTEVWGGNEVEIDLTG